MICWVRSAKVVKKKENKVLVTTLDQAHGGGSYKVSQRSGDTGKYLHSDIDTLERAQIIRDMRLDVFDVLVGINLLREGLDIPEITLVAILDADKEGFLRSGDIPDPDHRKGGQKCRRPCGHVCR